MVLPGLSIMVVIIGVEGGPSGSLCRRPEERHMYLKYVTLKHQLNICDDYTINLVFLVFFDVIRSIILVAV